MAAYVRRKRVGNHEYYQLVQSRRVDGAPRQRVLLHLGHYETAESALKGWPREIKRLRAGAKKDRRRLEALPEREGSAGWAKKIARQAEAAEKRAEALQANLEKLRELKKQGAL